LTFYQLLNYFIVRLRKNFRFLILNKCAKSLTLDALKNIGTVVLKTYHPPFGSELRVERRSQTDACQSGQTKGSKVEERF